MYVYEEIEEKTWSLRDTHEEGDRRTLSLSLSLSLSLHSRHVIVVIRTRQ